MSKSLLKVTLDSGFPPCLHLKNDVCCAETTTLSNYSNDPMLEKFCYCHLSWELLEIKIQVSTFMQSFALNRSLK